MSALLSIKNLWKDFGGFVATRDVTFDLEEGERHAIIGPNGAGKTTFFNLITGHMHPSKGSVEFRGKDITGIPPHKVVKLGIARSFQRINIFPRMSVFENVQVALMSREDQSLKMFKLCFDLHVAETNQLLDTVGLLTEAEETAGELAYGKQKQLELAIALAENPDVLLLDEPTAGMARADTNNTIDLLKQIKDERDITIAIIEHDMHVVFSLAERITVLAQGTPLVEDTPDNIKGHPKVREAYLGESQDAA